MGKDHTQIKSNLINQYIFNLIYLCIYLLIYVGGYAHHSASVEFRGQLVGVNSLLLCGSWYSNSGIKLGGKYFYLLSLWPLIYIFNLFYF